MSFSVGTVVKGQKNTDIHITGVIKRSATLTRDDVNVTVFEVMFQIPGHETAIYAAHEDGTVHVLKSSWSSPAILEKLGG